MDNYYKRIRFMEILDKKMKINNGIILVIVYLIIKDNKIDI